MSNTVRVICPDCGDVVEHHCHSDLRQAIVRLLTWVPESGVATEALEAALIEAGRVNGWIEAASENGEKPDFDAPFFGSQAWSYPLFGSKDTARTFHALIHNVVRAAGVDPDAIEQDYWTKRKAREQADKDHRERVQKKRDERTEIAAFLKSDAPMEDRIKKLDEIIVARAKGLKPFADPKDGAGFHHLYRYLDTYYGGGINAEMNRARISKLERETFERMQTDQDSRR